MLKEKKLLEKHAIAPSAARLCYAVLARRFQPQIPIAPAIQRSKITTVDAARQIATLDVANQHKNRGGIANQKPVRRMGKRMTRSLLKE
jgi:hypothetical protein